MSGDELGIRHNRDENSPRASGDDRQICPNYFIGAAGSSGLNREEIFRRALS